MISYLIICLCWRFRKRKIYRTAFRNVRVLRARPRRRWFIYNLPAVFDNIAEKYKRRKKNGEDVFDESVWRPIFSSNVADVKKITTRQHRRRKRSTPFEYSFYGEAALKKTAVYDRYKRSTEWCTRVTRRRRTGVVDRQLQKYRRKSFEI